MFSTMGNSTQNSNMSESKASLDDSPELENYQGYHGYMPREEVNRLLRNQGDFILRQTELQSGEGFQLVLSVRVDEKACHFPVSMNAHGRFYVNRQRDFSTVTDLVLHYWQSGEEINERTHAICRNHIQRQPWELQRDQISVGELLGHGEFGAVHRGTIKQGDVEYAVAVKLHKVKALKKEMIKDFLAEARLLREYKHPNIVQFYGVSIDKEPIMLCMELANGGSLDKYLRKNKAMATDKTRLTMCVEAARGLAYLHSKNCIHRDVSARNCLMSDNQIKISDFGLAHQLAQTAQSANASDLDKMPVRWLAPEAMLGTTSPKSDVYSFGVLMWEIYSDAEMPFKEKTLLQVFEAVQHKREKLQKPDAMSTKVGEIMLKCFERDPTNRDDMATVRDNLENRLDKPVKHARSDRDDKSKKHKDHKKPKGHKLPKSHKKSKDRKKSKASKKSVSKSVKSPH